MIKNSKEIKYKILRTATVFVTFIFGIQNISMFNFPETIFGFLCVLLVGFYAYLNRDMVLAIAPNKISDTEEDESEDSSGQENKNQSQNENNQYNGKYTDEKIIENLEQMNEILKEINSEDNED